MNRILLVFLALVVSVTSVDARWGRHHGQRSYYGIPRDGPSDRDAYYSRSIRSGAIPEPRYRNASALVPSDWQLQPPDPNWNGKRYLSPEGTAWFAVYASPVEEEPISAHMKAVTFAEGEAITYLRGERDWIAVSGYKGDRIFYRKAILACAGRTWHHIAFEYPTDAKLRMDKFVNFAAAAVQHSEADGCDPAISSTQ